MKWYYPIAILGLSYGMTVAIIEIMLKIRASYENKYKHH
jgi:hypothetical protein